jgi:hypothetical protein
MELLLNMGQRAVGLAVEIHSQSSQHSRKGVVRMVVPQQLCIVVQFGGVSTPLKVEHGRLRVCLVCGLLM